MVIEYLKELIALSAAAIIRVVYSPANKKANKTKNATITATRNRHNTVIQY